jgi:uncharacterized protein (DUF1697 family)
MKTYIALFRGINVGGKHALPMKELMAILEGLGAQTVKTYIQSGNAVFARQEQDPLLLSQKIRAEIKQRRGFEPQVLVLELTDLERVIKQNPFPEAETDPKALHVSFLVSAPTKANLKALEGLKKESERFELIDRVFYLHAPAGVGRSKLAATAEKLLGAPLTDRNWRTVCALWEIAQALR